MTGPMTSLKPETPPPAALPSAAISGRPLDALAVQIPAARVIFSITYKKRKLCRRLLWAGPLTFFLSCALASA